MYGYIRGKITLIDSSYVIIENNDIGYIIYVPNPYSYKLNDNYTIYTYNHIREDENLLYGFTSREEKELFLKLINVKGLGPKMALPIIATGSLTMIADAVENENINYLKKFPKIGDKVAKQMVLDFIRRDEKVLAKMDSPTTVYIGFYQKLLDGVDESNSCLYKLIKTSKKDSLFDSPRYESIEGMDDGDVVNIHYDDETETYIVYDLSGAELGEISKSDSKKIANKLEKYNAVPVITEIDYDEKDRPTAKIKIYFK